MLCWRSTRTGLYQMAIVLPATLMTRDSGNCSLFHWQPNALLRIDQTILTLRTRQSFQHSW
jgi:hypothetical protein